MPFTAADLASQLERNAGAMPAAMAAAVLLVLLLAVAAPPLAGADDPYRYFTWTVTYGPISPLGTTQQVWVSGVSLPILVSILEYTIACHCRC